MNLEKVKETAKNTKQKVADASIRALNSYMQWSLRTAGKEFPKSASVALYREYDRLGRPIDIDMPITTYELLAHGKVVVISNHSVDPGIALAGLPYRCDNNQQIIMSEDNEGYLPPEIAAHATFIDIDHQQTEKNGMRKAWMWWKGGPKRSEEKAKEFNINSFRELIRNERKNGGVVVMMPQGIHTDEEEWLDGPVSLLRMLSRYGFHVVHGHIAAVEKISPGFPAVFPSPAAVTYGEPELLSDMFARLETIGITEDKDIARVLQQENNNIEVEAPHPVMKQKNFWKLFAATSVAALGISILMEKRRQLRKQSN